jgi:pSer/pThr/pTyr-binding forkhead associated (FHA) protein
MGDFAVLAFKIAFLAALWLFIGLIAVTIRTDLVGHRVKAPALPTPAPAPAITPTPKAASAPPVPARPKQRANAKKGKRASVLAIDSGQLSGQRLQLVDEVRIGRSVDCELFLDDEYVTSKHPHARLDRRPDGAWVLTDLGSTNGTYVNGRRLTEPKVVSPADTIQVGRTQMRLEY